MAHQLENVGTTLEIHSDSTKAVTYLQIINYSELAKLLGKVDDFGIEGYLENMRSVLSPTNWKVKWYDVAPTVSVLFTEVFSNGYDCVIIEKDTNINELFKGL